MEIFLQSGLVLDSIRSHSPLFYSTMSVAIFKIERSAEYDILTYRLSLKYFESKILQNFYFMQ